MNFSFLFTSQPHAFAIIANDAENINCLTPAKNSTWTKKLHIGKIVFPFHKHLIPDPE